MAVKIKITFLGTGDAIPTSKRNHTSIFLQCQKENILIDCGEGTQRQFKKAKLNPCKINRILITHWHGDHVLGIPGLLQTLALNEYNKTLEIYGPEGTKKYVHKMIEAFKFAGDKYPLKIKEASKNPLIKTNNFEINSINLKHSIPTLGYSFVLYGKTRINKEKLKKSGLPEGPLLQELKKGKDIIYKNKKFRAKNLTYVEKSKKISFILDTLFFNEIIKFVKDSDLLICEATFSKEIEEQALEKKHLTSEQAAIIAKKAKVKKLILTHASSRYEKNLNKIISEAKKIFKEVVLAKDFYCLEI